MLVSNIMQRAVVSGQSVEIDLTQAPGTTFEIVPAIPGKAFVPTRVHSVITAEVAVTSTSSVKIGTNATHDNFNAAGVFPPGSATAIGVGAESALNPTNNGKLLAANTPVIGEITVSAVATALKAVFVYDGYFIDA